MYDYVMSHSLPLALLGAYFIPFALAAYAVIVGRAIGRRFRRGQVLLLALFVVMVALEIWQLAATGRSFRAEADPLGLSRYFGVLAPLLWIFAAKGAADLWNLAGSRARPLVRLALVLALGYVAFDMNLGPVVEYRTKMNARDTEVAVARLAPKILEDYRGPREQREFKRTLDEYYTGLRPVVASPFGAAAWAVRGDHSRTTGMKCPYPEDYLCFPLDSGYGGIRKLDEKEYTFIASAPGGLGTRWVLFRRRKTPGFRR